MASSGKSLIPILLIVGFIALFLYLNPNILGNQAITGSETMIRNLPLQVDPGQSFILTYTAVGTSGAWGASIVDNVTGGCTYPGSVTQYRTVMVSTEGQSKSVTVVAPSSGTCIFKGDYKYGTTQNKNFVNQAVSVCVRNTFADLNCDQNVDRSELGEVITDWLSGSVTRDNLGQAITAWVGVG